MNNVLNTSSKVEFDTDVQVEFLKHLTETGIVKVALAKVGVDPSVLYKAQKENPRLKEAVQIAKAMALNEYAAAAKSRALHGVEENVYYEGRVVGTKTVYDNRLLTFMMESLERGSFRKNDSNVNITQNINTNDDATLSKLGSFLKIDLHASPSDDESEYDSQTKGEQQEGDIIDGEYHESTSE